MFKLIISFLLTTYFSGFNGQTSNGYITSHVLDIGLGKPGPNIRACLYLKKRVGLNTDWNLIRSDISNQDGRFLNLSQNFTLVSGIYKIEFDMDSYYKAKDLYSFFPEVSIAFEVLDESQHYHVPLVTNQYGYSTYRGS
jgi:5-hydroxyisourate hydrolase